MLTPPEKKVVIRQEDEKYFVVDVSTLSKWNRSPVGIIRTQLELVAYLLKYVQTTMYFKFASTKNDLIKVEYDEISQIVARLLNFKATSSFISDQSIVKAGNNRIVLLLERIRQLYRNEGMKIVLVRICKKGCPYFLKHLVKVIIRLFSEYLNSIKQNAYKSQLKWMLFSPEIQQLPQTIPVFLSSNSIVISIGLDWDDSNYQLMFWLKKKINFEFVGAFYDGIPIVYPHLVRSLSFSQKYFWHFYYLIHLSDKIFCISDYSKSQLKEICESHSLQKKPVLQTIHLGDSVSRKEIGEAISKRKHKQNYILYVSTIEARKNHKLLLDIWNELLSDKYFDVPDLIFVGMMGWGIDELKQDYLENVKLQKSIHFYDDVDDMELEFMYRNALFTVFPSFAEGWGLGAVESMLYGKPCIISNNPALIEATQGLMPALPSDNIEAWATMIKELITDPRKIEKLEEIIKDKFKSRSWEKFSLDFIHFAREAI
jgi:glycosyltransferase involved in cell wall biosynthesis